MENVWYDFKHGFMERLRSLKGRRGLLPPARRQA